MGPALVLLTSSVLALGALVLLLAAAGGGASLNLNYHWKQLPLPK